MDTNCLKASQKMGMVLIICFWGGIVGIPYWDRMLLGIKLLLRKPRISHMTNF